MMPKVSMFADHVGKWKGGCGSENCAAARKKVFARGTLPCDVLLIGEGPGESEDVIGSPFVGPAGALLDSMIAQSGLDTTHYCTLCLKGHRFVRFPSPKWKVGTGSPLCDNGHGESFAAHIRLAFTNLVCCVPRDPDTGRPDAPSKAAIKACAPRLAEMIALAKPRAIVCVGSLAEKNAHPPEDFKGVVTAIAHPAALLRANIAQRGLLIQQCVVKLETFAEELGCS